jgi:hypothetical protein
MIVESERQPCSSARLPLTFDDHGWTRCGVAVTDQAKAQWWRDRLHRVHAELTR